MKTPVAANSPDFDVLNASKVQPMDEVDAKTGKMVVPARWPDVGLLTRRHLRIDVHHHQLSSRKETLCSIGRR